MDRPLIIKCLVYSSKDVVRLNERSIRAFKKFGF